MQFNDKMKYAFFKLNNVFSINLLAEIFPDLLKK